MVKKIQHILKKLHSSLTNTQLNNCPKVKVLWRDAVSHATWQDPEEVKKYKPAVNCTEGKVLVDNDDVIICFMTWNDTDIGDVCVIPKENVIEIVR